MDAQALRAALGRFTTGVTVITCCGPDGRLAGVTANSFNSVSLDPPLVLWSLARRAGSLPAFQTTSHWAVHVLAHDQSDLSTRFARSGSDKFAGLELERSADGTPLLSGCAARFLCRSFRLYDGGDHVILVGEVVDFVRNDTPPLVYHDSGYAIATSTETQWNAVCETDSTTAASLAFLLGSAYLYHCGQLREAGGRMGFLYTELFVLLALGERSWRSRTEINSLLDYAGQSAAPQVLDDLEARGILIAREGKHHDREETEFDLTADGRAIAEQLKQTGKRLEDDMANTLGASGTIALRALLTRFLRDTELNRPVKWL